MPRHAAPPRSLRLTALWQGLGLSLALGPATCLANGAIEEDVYFEPMPVVLTASRLPQPLQDAPGAMTVIDRELIEATNYRNIPRLLRMVPGMHIGYERGHATWVSYHGLGLSSPGEMQVLVDGATVYVPVNFGTINWSGVPIFLSDVERIEVVRGASANTLGASALLGTVNLITRAGGEEPGAHVTTLLGDSGIRDVEVGWSGNVAPVALRVTAGEQHDDGFTGLHDTRTTQRLSLRADTRVDAENTVTMRLGSSRERPERGYPDSPLNNNDVRTANDRSDMLHLRWQHITDADTEWSASLYHHRIDFEDHWTGDAPGFPDVPLGRDHKDWRTGLEFQARDRLGSTLRGVWGASTNETRTQSVFLFDRRADVVMRQRRVFGNLEWQPDALFSVNAGLAAEAQYDGWHLSPRLYGSFRSSPGMTWRMGASRAWRAPSSFERDGHVVVRDPVSNTLLASPYVPNEDIRETRADTFEMGFIRQFETAHSMLDLRLFQEKLKDLIIRNQVSTLSGPTPLLESAVATTQFQNYDDTVTLTGLEIQFSAHPWDGGTVRLAYSLIDRSAKSEAIASGIAPYTAHVNWQQDWPGRWTSYVSVTRVGPVASGDSFVANGRYLVDDFTTVDISVSRRLSLFGQPARFSLTALNLGPRHQEIADPAMQMVYGNRAANRVSRLVYAGLSVNF